MRRAARRPVGVVERARPGAGLDGERQLHERDELGRVGGLGRRQVGQALLQGGGVPALHGRHQRLEGGVGQVQPRQQGDVGGGELGVGEAALGHRVGVEVVAGDDREDGLDGRVRPRRLDGLELVDPHVGLAEQADLAVGVGQRGGPLGQRHPVGRLHRVEEVEVAARVAGAPHVGDDHDVAAVDQVVDVGVGDGRRVDDERLAVGGLLQQHREGSRGRGAGSGLHREVDVGPQYGAVGHGDGQVEQRPRVVGGRLRAPGRRGRRHVRLVGRRRGGRQGVRPGRQRDRARPVLAGQHRPQQEAGHNDHEGDGPHGQPPGHRPHVARPRPPAGSARRCQSLCLRCRPGMPNAPHLPVSQQRNGAGPRDLRCGA